ncbi:MAG: DUF1624 domain-containing protein, partial [Firmicutes bacterium]|nr:DUF1624 domain-containing protein [Bacillota bacterium]
MFVFHYHFVVSTLGHMFGDSLAQSGFVKASDAFFEPGILFDKSMDQLFLSLVFFFPLLSGITSTFHTTDIKPFSKAGKFVLVAGAISLVSFVIDQNFAPGLYIRFGIIHMLALSMLLYAFLAMWTNHLCNKIFSFIASHKRPLATTTNAIFSKPIPDQQKFVQKCTQITQAIFFAVIGLVMIIIGLALDFPLINTKYSNTWAWLGLINGSYTSGDYYPMLPYAGYFFVGIAIGKAFYASRKSLLP